MQVQMPAAKLNSTLQGADHCRIFGHVVGRLAERALLFDDRGSGALDNECESRGPGIAPRTPSVCMLNTPTALMIDLDDRITLKE